jgi:hypothetical protein
MLVSTLELLVKRIAPLTRPANAAFRRVVQGYLLIICVWSSSRWSGRCRWGIVH